MCGTIIAGPLSLPISIVQAAKPTNGEMNEMTCLVVEGHFPLLKMIT